MMLLVGLSLMTVARAVCVTAAGGPASMVGFDLARPSHLGETIGRANGVVDRGGFASSLLTMAASAWSSTCAPLSTHRPRVGITWRHPGHTPPADVGGAEVPPGSVLADTTIGSGSPPEPICRDVLFS